MKTAVYYQGLIAMLVLLAIGSLLADCVGTPQKSYDQVQAELAEAQAVIADLEEALQTEQAKSTEIQQQLHESQARITEIEREFDIYRGHTLKSPKVRTITECVLPLNVTVRDEAISAAAKTPYGISADSDAWKIWQIHYWVSENIFYVSDPKGHEYFAYADETLTAKAGDCDDSSILLASMYESLGLDAAVSYIDTNDDGESDHMTCLVYWSGDADSLLDEEQAILKKMRLTVPGSE